VAGSRTPRPTARSSRGAFDAGRQERLVRPQQLLPSRGGAEDAAAAARRFPVLLIPAFYTAADDDLVFLADYARAGGHLVLGPRSLAGDREGRVRADRQPAGLAELAGVWYQEAANPGEPVPIETTGDAALSGAVVGYLQGLVPDGAEVLAGCRHPHLGRFAAVTTREVGAGRITVVGGVPDQGLARSLAAWLAPAPVAGWSDLPASVTVGTSTAPDGARVHVVHNWG
jgi:beta-galactosidase